MRTAAASESDVNGRFHLREVRPGFYLASATANGALGSPTVKLTVLPGQATAGVVLTVAPGGIMVSGTVRDATQGVIAAAEVKAIRYDLPGDSTSRIRAVRTDGNGVFALPVTSGDHVFVASASGYAPSQQVHNISIPATIDFSLPPAGRLGGRVVRRTTGQPLPAAEIALDLPELWWGGTRRATADSQGHFMFTDLDPGSYVLRAHHQRLTASNQTRIPVSVASFRDDLLVEMDDGITISGTIRSTSTREVVAGAKLSLHPDNQVFLLDRRTAPSQADGSFEFAGVQAGSHSIRVEADGFAPAEHEVHAATTDVLGLDLTLSPESAVHGKVVAGPNGAPVQGATVSAVVFGQNGGLRGMATGVVRTAADGSFRIPRLASGACQVEADHPDHGYAKLEDQSLALAEDKAVVLRLEPGTMVSGRVSWTDGAPAAGVFVSAGLVGMASSSTKTESGGDYRLGPLRAGPTSVVASRSGTMMAMLEAMGAKGSPAVRQLSLGGDHEIRGIDLVLDRGGHKISGQVVDPDGHPLPDVRLTAFPTASRLGESGMSGMAQVMGGSQVLSNADGFFEIVDLNSGSYTLTAQHPLYPQAQATAVAADSANVKVQFRREAIIVGRVIDQSGQPVTAFRIGTESANGEMDVAHVMSNFVGRYAHQQVANAEGKFEIRGLVAGAYRVVAETDDGRTGRVGPVQAMAGQQQSAPDIQVQPMRKLRGRLTAKATGQPVTGMVMVMADRKFRVATAAADGKFAIDNIAPGTITIMRQGYGSVTLSADKTNADGTVDLGDVALDRGADPDQTGK